LSNTQISQRLVLSRTAVSKHVSNIFMKLDMPPGEDNRRVRAVLTWLRAKIAAYDR
jgi:DNA-binding NarL/FixJ family response regulator